MLWELPLQVISYITDCESSLSCRDDVGDEPPFTRAVFSRKNNRVPNGWMLD